MATITITELPGTNPLYRVELNGADGKPMLSRRFREKHIALGMAIVAGQELSIDPELTIRQGVDDENEG